MNLLDSVKNGITDAVDTVSGVTQAIIKKNRDNAQLNRLKAVMKNECEIINRAYIALGKKYYDNKTNNSDDTCSNEEELFATIRKAKANIEKARIRYRKIIENQTAEFVTEYELSDLEDINICDDRDCQETEEIPESNPEVADDDMEIIPSAD